MSSKQIVSFMPGRSSARSGSESPSGCSRASRMAASGSLQGRQRLARVEDPAAAGGEPLEPERLAVVEEDRRRGAIDVEDEAGTGHQMLSLSRSDRRSKAILTAPRVPASAAWAMASS